MLRIKDKKNYNNNNFCLGEIIKGELKGKRIYYSDDYDNTNDDVFKLDIELTPKYIRTIKKDINMSDIKTIKKYMNNEIKEISEDLKYIYDIIVEQQKKEKDKSILLKDKNIFRCIPDIDFDYEEPFIKSNHIYVAGSSGCGKSYWIGEYLKLINKYQKGRDIFIFSDVDEDPALDNLKNVHRIALDESLLEEPIYPDELRDSICIFDDIDSIQDKKLKDNIYTLMDSIYKRGRHENITCISTTHNITNYTRSRTAINESSMIVLFCKSGSTSGQKYILDKYCGLDKKTINEILKLNTRYVQIHKNYPQFYAWDKGVKLIKD